MNNPQREELLDKQLELLAEESKKSVSVEELAALTHAICEIYIALALMDALVSVLTLPTVE